MPRRFTFIIERKGADINQEKAAGRAIAETGAKKGTPVRQFRAIGGD